MAKDANEVGPLENLHELARSRAHDLMAQMDPDPPHALQVSRLALNLFDQLVPIHGFGKEERLLLECAALLHDIGWTTRPSAHHKGSRDAILGEELNGLDSRQQVIVALVARYHRKSLPSRRHAHYEELAEADRRLVRVLAAILRLADGLDRSHTNNVEIITCTIHRGTLHLGLVTRDYPDAELYGLKKKADLFEEEFGLKVLADAYNYPGLADQ